MPMRIVVVSDTSPVRALDHLNRLDLLSRLFERVLIPSAVADELRRGSRKCRPFDPREAGLPVRSPADSEHVARLRLRLDAGEAEAIALAVEVRADVLLIDEREGVRVAQGEGLMTLGVLGLLVRAKEVGEVERVEPLIDSLREGIGFRVTPEVEREILRRAGEA